MKKERVLEKTKHCDLKGGMTCMEEWADTRTYGAEREDEEKNVQHT